MIEVGSRVAGPAVNMHRAFPWILLACLAGVSSAQTSGTPADSSSAPKKQYPPGTLHSIVIKGNRLYQSPDIIAASGLKIGQRLTAPILDEARAKLQATELFTNVGYRFQYSAGPVPAYDVSFEVTENEQTFPLRFDRLGASPDSIRRYLKDHVPLYADRIPGTQGVLRRYSDVIQQFLAKTNPSIKVKAFISNDDPKELSALFTPDSAAPTISQVVVSGNQAVDTGTILRAVNQVAIGVPLSETRLQLILNGAIKPLYAAKGYAAVSFPKIETEPSKTNLGVIVKVEIKDGPVFKFGAIHFHGNGLDEDEIRSTIPFKPGQNFNGEQVDNFRLEMIRRMTRRGFLDAGVSTEAEPDDSKRAVDVTFNVVPGPVYNFGKLDIQGLDVTTEPVIAKLWGEKPGKPFNPDYPDFFLKRVQEQGIFDNLSNTSSDYTADPSTHDVTVHLYFKGGKSAKDKEREKKDEEERRKSDGTWSPYPPL